MGVYINGMDMPSIDLEWRIIRGQDGKWYAIDVNAETSDGEWHEIVSVPPHGRLVDADKLMQEMRLFIKENMLSRDDARELLETIKDAPTVLEAEEGE